MFANSANGKHIGKLVSSNALNIKHVHALVECRDCEIYICMYRKCKPIAHIFGIVIIYIDMSRMHLCSCITISISVSEIYALKSPYSSYYCCGVTIAGSHRNEIFLLHFNDISPSLTNMYGIKSI